MNKTLENCYLDECVSLPKPKSQLAQLHDDDEDVFATSVIDRYAARPLALQDICLATFAIMYDVIQSSTQTEETESVNTQQDKYNTENPETSTKIKLQKGFGIIRRGNNRQNYVLEDTKFIQNQKNITMQSSSYITHGIKKVT